MTSLVMFLSASSVLLASMSSYLAVGDLVTLGALDVLSSGLIWLVVFGVSLSVLASSKEKAPILWWTLALVLLISFWVENLFHFYMLFELSLIPILLMLLFFGTQPERVSAGLYFASYTLMMSLPYMGLLFFSMKDLSFNETTKMMTGGLMSVFLVTPFLVKMPVFGIHYWLPKAHVEASTSGSMVLAGLLLKLGGYGVARAGAIWVLKLNSLMSMWMLLSILSAALTFMQSDVKKLVAYSSITHMTFLMLGLSMNITSQTMIVIMLSLAHGWASMGMFFSAGSLSQSSGSRLSSAMSFEHNLHWFGLLLGLMLVSNASVPPMPSFFPELLLVLSLSVASATTVSLFLLLSLLVCYYNAFLFIAFNSVKQPTLTLSATSLNEGTILASMTVLSILSLGWLLMFKQNKAQDFLGA